MDSGPRDSFTLRQSAYLVDSAKQIAAKLSAEVKSFLCLTAESLGSFRPGSGGSCSEQTATCESLDTVPGEQGQPRTVESLGTCGCQTVDSLAPIPETAEAQSGPRLYVSEGSLSESDGDSGRQRVAAAPLAGAAAATVPEEDAAANEEIAPS